ncbi:TonB family protein [bacterium]|nr:TonB family protein [bacterium]NIN91644.1 TonB family protein [bacterium]NIO17992.1 TonB family protein [bacterium]NIO72957.1 TonB family protein [bacterium]
MLVPIKMKYDIVCWTIAIGLHLLLFLVNFNLYRTGEAKNLIPVVEIEYITHEDIVRARRVRVPGKPPQTFTEKLKHFFSKKVVPAKKEEVLAGKAPSKLEADKIKGLSQETTLVDKEGTLSKKVDLSLKNKPKGKAEEKLLYKEESTLVVSKEAKLKDFKLQNLKDKGYKVAKRDLPFQVSARERIKGEEDIVGIDLGKQTSKGILTQAPSLKDIEEKEGFGEGVFRVVKQEDEGKLSGSEVLVNLLAIAKKEEARKTKEYESLLGSGVDFAGQGGSLKEVKSEEKGRGGAFAKGVVFSRAPAKESGSGSSGSRSAADKKVAKREPRGRVIFEIRGPLSRRTVLYREIPSYPEWAEKKGIEAGVSVHFVVLSNGKVKDNIYVVRTSGYPVLDKLVMEALRNWRFASLKGDLYGKEEWGVLTFYFSFEGGV